MFENIMNTGASMAFNANVFLIFYSEPVWYKTVSRSLCQCWHGWVSVRISHQHDIL